MRENPHFDGFLQEELGAALVGTPYNCAALTYARAIYDDDPLRTLVARQLFLFASTPDWFVNEAQTFSSDAVIGIEAPSEHPSSLARACADAGLPYLTLPTTADTDEARERLRSFFARLG
jgi:hypothetical protein